MIKLISFIVLTHLCELNQQYFFTMCQIHIHRFLRLNMIFETLAKIKFVNIKLFFFYLLLLCF